MTEFKITLKKIIIKIFKIFVLFHLILFIVLFTASYYLKYFNPKTTSLMLYRSKYYNFNIKKIIFIPGREVPPEVFKMFIVVEDPNFYNHHGIELGALLSAYRLNRKLGYSKYGGSTITQQLARSLLLVPDKTYIRKYLEILTALTMETVLSKERILELYVNYIEFGKGVFGMGQASLYHFAKPFKQLETPEIIRLVTILPNPILFDPYNFLTNKHLKQRFLTLVRMVYRE